MWAFASHAGSPNNEDTNQVWVLNVTSDDEPCDDGSAGTGMQEYCVIMCYMLLIFWGTDDSQVSASSSRSGISAGPEKVPKSVSYLKLVALLRGLNEKISVY